ncbi:TonB-dependent receptor [Aureibacter tunicatorum]|uniref:Outer membrane cobalamin receptor n=1 Tax=Aureibacter tunicatorum TaxID=866807 RepID=A0AAE4BS92_9BACT|nr:TonB-dependent receptor plug domain-containing protein [Aureibacter tunicatorum]MDR6239516.1 outer membrane cobalamin receptor [Aureibacter tunicatorum]
MKQNIFLKAVAISLLILLTHFTQAQISGIVLDQNSKEPLISATIISGKNFTTTAADGTFSIQAQIGDSIEIKYLGYHNSAFLIDNDYLKISLKPETAMLDAVNVVALKEEEAEKRRIKAATVAPVTIIGSQELLTKAGNLNEILARQAGIQIRQSGGLGSAARINIRGLEGKRVQLYVDGNPLNTPDGSLGINDIPLQVIERVEIYKGSVPAWLGGDGLGSAVNIVTKHRDVSYIDANIAHQSYNTSNLGLILKKSWKSIQAGIGVFNTQADNNYKMAIPDQENLIVERDHDKFHSLLIGGGITFNNLWFDEVDFEGAYMSTHKEIQGITQNIQHAENKGKTYVGVMNLSKTGLWNDKLSFRYTLIRAKIDVAMVDTSSYSYNWDGTRTPSIYGKGELGIGPNMSNTEQNELRQRLNLNYRLGKASTLNFNQNFRKSNLDPRDDVANEHAGKNLFNYPAHLFHSVTSLTFEQENKNQKLLFSSAVKHYYNHTEGYNTNIYVQGEPEYIKTNTQSWGYVLGMRYTLNEYLLAKAVHERAVRLPNTQELFGDGVLITPSITLQPEEAYNFTAGLVYDRILKNYRRFQAEVNGFYMNVDNLIQLAGNGLSIGYVNYAKVYITGADVEVKADITSWLYAGINMTYQRVVDNNKYIPGTKEVDNPTYKKDIPNIPQLFANLNAEAHKDNLFLKKSKSRLIYNLSFTDAFNYGFALSVNDKFVIPKVLTHTASIEQAFQEDRFTITFEVNNITDELVINNYNQPLPGRTYRIKLRCLLLGKQTHNHN